MEKLEIAFSRALMCPTLHRATIQALDINPCPIPNLRSSSDSRSDGPGETRNLPVPVPRPSEIARAGGDGRFRAAARDVRLEVGLDPRSDLKDVLDARAGETGFSPEESAMLKNILGCASASRERDGAARRHRRRAAGHRARRTAQSVRGRRHSRLVVYDDTLDDAVGMVHIRDLIAFMTERAAASAKANTRRKKPLPAGLDLKAIDLSDKLSGKPRSFAMLFAPPSMPVLDLLARMQATRIHLALVVDEYGGTDGLVSIEDIVEQIVGEIDDEHDEDEPPGAPARRFVPRRRPRQSRRRHRDRRRGIRRRRGRQEVDTLGGYLVTRVGRVPVRGELVPGPGRFEIEVLDADPRRVKQVRILRSRQPRRASMAPSGACRRPRRSRPPPQSGPRPSRGRVKPADPTAAQPRRAIRDVRPSRPTDRLGLGLAAR